MSHPFIIARRLIIISAFFTAEDLSAQNKKPTVAVLEFTSSGGLSPSETRTLTDRFRDMLVQTEAYTVIERDEMETIFKEQDFIMSDNCNSAECAVEVGRLLGAEQMLAGDIGKLGETWTTSLRLIDVSTGKIIKTQTGDHTGRVDGLLEVMRRIAFIFAGLQAPGEKGTLITRFESGAPGRQRLTVQFGFVPNSAFFKTEDESLGSTIKADAGTSIALEYGFLTGRKLKISANLTLMRIVEDSKAFISSTDIIAISGEATWFLSTEAFRPYISAGPGLYNQETVINRFGEHKTKMELLLRAGAGIEVNLGRAVALNFSYKFNKLSGNQLSAVYTGLVFQFGKPAE
jgi:opacity protein-like surface antigen